MVTTILDIPEDYDKKINMIKIVKGAKTKKIVMEDIIKYYLDSVGEISDSTKLY